jgi:hypothetical protein
MMSVQDARGPYESWRSEILWITCRSQSSFWAMERVLRSRNAGNDAGQCPY